MELKVNVHADDLHKVEAGGMFRMVGRRPINPSTGRAQITLKYIETFSKTAAEMLDDAFMAVYNTRGSSPEMLSARANRQARQNALLDMMAAMTGRSAEAVYEEFSDRLQANVEHIVAAQEG